MTQRLTAVTLAQLPRGLEDFEFAEGECAVGGVANAQRPGVVQHAQQQVAALWFREGAVVRLHPRHPQQFGHHQLVLVRALPDVERGQVKAEDLHRAAQRPQPRLYQGLGVMGTQALGDHVEIGQQLLGGAIGVLWRHGVAQGLGAGERLQRGGQPGIDADQRAPVGLVFPVLVVVG